MRFLLALVFSFFSSTIALSQASPCYWSGQLTKCYPTTGLYLDAQRSLRLGDATTNYVETKAPSSVTSYTLTMPAAQGGAGTIMANDGSGALAWIGPVAVPQAPSVNAWYYVSQYGSDITGDGTYDKPLATTTAALALITDASTTKRYGVHIRGTVTEASIHLKPYVWYYGDTWGASRLNVTGAGTAITLDPTAFTAGNSRSGMTNVYLTGTTGINLDFVGVSASGSHVVEMDHLGVNGAVVLNGNNNNQYFQWEGGGLLFSDFTLHGSNGLIVGLFVAGNTLVDNGTALLDGAGVNFQSDFLGGNFTITGSGAHANPVQLTASTVAGTTTVSGSGSALQTDAISVGLKSSISLVSGGTMTRTSDVFAEAYTPTTSADWNSVPTQAAQALDTLASAGIVKSQAQNLVSASPSGSSGVPSYRSLVAGDIPNLDASKITTGTLPVARGGTGVTSSTGTVAVVLSTSPTLVTPLLGTPTSVTLTNATGLPLTTGVTGVLPTANGGTGISTAYTSGSVIFADSSGFLNQDNGQFKWDDTLHNLSLGGHLSTAALGISLSGTEVGFDLTSTASNTALQVNNQGAQIAAQFINATNSATQGAAFGGAFSRGTTSARTAVQAGDQVATFSGQSYNGAAFGPGFNAAMAVIATENQTATHNGGEIVLATTPNASLAPTAALIMGQNQLMQLPAYTTAGILQNDTSGNITSVAAVPIAKGGTGQATKSGGYDALSPLTTLGDTVYGGAAGTGTRLPGNATTTTNFLSQTGTGAVSAAPVWGTLSAGDIPNLDASKITTGTFPTARGGTNQTTWTAGSVPYLSNTTTFSEDNANFFWDGTNHRLGIGVTAPTKTLTVSGTTASNTTDGQVRIVAGSGATDAGLEFRTAADAGRRGSIISPGSGSTNQNGLNFNTLTTAPAMTISDLGLLTIGASGGSQAHLTNGTMKYQPTDSAGVQSGIEFADAGSGSGEGLWLQWSSADYPKNSRLVAQGDGVGGQMLFQTNVTTSGNPTTNGQLDHAGAWTLGASGGTQAHKVNGSLNVTKIFSSTASSDSTTGSIIQLSVPSSVIKMTGGSAVTLKGINSSGITEGTLLIIENHTGSNMTINDEDGSAAGADQIVTYGPAGSAKTMPNGNTGWFVYSSARWRMAYIPNTFIN